MILSIAKAALLAALVTSAGGAAPSAESRRPARKPPPPPPVVHASCPEALSDGSLVDEHLGERLAALAAEVKWADGASSVNGPTPCQRDVRLHCGPDMDRDGDQEAIVEITSRDFAEGQSCGEANASGDPPPATLRHLFLVSRHAATWRPVARLAVIVDDEAVDPARPPAYFVRQPGGKLAVRVDSIAARGACQVGGYALFALRGGALVSIGKGGLSPACVPCGCR